MWSITGSMLLIWLKLTILLAAVVGLVWWFSTPGWLMVSLISAGLIEWWAIGKLCREWSSLASWEWWWK